MIEVELVPKQQAYSMIEGPFSGQDVDAEDQRQRCLQEFEAVRSALASELGRLGRAGYRASDDFDITQPLILSVGDRLVRHIDVCIISKAFLAKPFLEIAHGAVTRAVPEYCISVHTDPRIEPRLLLFVRPKQIHIYCPEAKLLDAIVQRAKGLS